MNNAVQHTIYSIGHSTHSIGDFIGMLQSFGIKNLVDIRSIPGSRKFPHFNKNVLEAELFKHDICYIHMVGLGGRRKVRKDSENTCWRNVSFRAYADYMGTGDFKNAVSELENTALQSPTAYMCAEAVWWRCHRALVSDYLKAKGWKVMHITDIGKAKEHTYTPPAKIAGGQVFYTY